MFKQIDTRAALALIAGVVVVLGVIGYCVLNPLGSVPPPPKGKPTAVATVPAPPPADMIHHGPIGP